jgi:hypothetical protein
MKCQHYALEKYGIKPLVPERYLCTINGKDGIIDLEFAKYRDNLKGYKKFDVFIDRYKLNYYVAGNTIIIRGSQEKNGNDIVTRENHLSKKIEGNYSEVIISEEGTMTIKNQLFPFIKIQFSYDYFKGFSDILLSIFYNKEKDDLIFYSHGHIEHKTKFLLFQKENGEILPHCTYKLEHLLST